MIHPDDIEDGRRLWDASPDVCCAAFQLGACPHTEYAWQYDDRDDWPPVHETDGPHYDSPTPQS